MHGHFDFGAGGGRQLPGGPCTSLQDKEAWRLAVEDSVLVTVELARSRNRLDFSHHKILGVLVTYESMWCFQSVLCQVEGDDLLFGELLEL